MELSPESIRVLGCLLEKEATTPDIYPLTLNSLLSACNQKSNRHPVVNYDEETVAEAIEALRAAKLAFRVDAAGARVAKYRHNLDERLGLSRAGKALLTVLLLRGPQTLGELRTRTERMFAFATTELVERELLDISEEVDLPLWQRYPRAPGQKEDRYIHLLGGMVSAEPDSESGHVPLEPAMASVQARKERIDQLEAEVGQLRTELAELKTAFSEFRQQFD